MLARVTRAAGGTSLRVGQGTRPLSVGVECVARRPRHIDTRGPAVPHRLGRGAPASPPRAAPAMGHARAPTHSMQATAVTCHTHRGERPRLEHARRRIQANAHKRRRAGQPPARRRTNGGWSCRGEGTNTGQAPADSAHRDGRPMTLRPSDASGQTLASPHAIARRRDRRRQTARRLRWQQCQ